MKWLAIALLCVAADAAAAQDAKIDTGAGVAVSLQRGGCERRCAVYRVTLHGDGRVVYLGQHFVRKAGTARSRVKRAEVRRLVGAFEALDFFGLKDSYGGDPGDCQERREDTPRSTLTLSLQGRSKSVIHNVGCVGPVTSRLTELGQAVDRLANTTRWIK